MRTSGSGRWIAGPAIASIAAAWIAAGAAGCAGEPAAPEPGRLTAAEKAAVDACAAILGEGEGAGDLAALADVLAGLDGPAAPEALPAFLAAAEERVRARVADDAPARERAAALVEAVTGEKGIRVEAGADDVPAAAARQGRGSRLAAVHLSLLLARQVGFPVAAAAVPDGLLLKWDAEPDRFVFEPADDRPIPEDRLVARYGFPPDAIASGIYLEALKPAEAAAVLLLPVERRLAARGRLAAAEALLEGIQRRLPRYPPAMVEAGALDLRRSAADPALRDFHAAEAARVLEEARALDPGYEPATVELVGAFVRLRRGDEGIRILEEALRARPRSLVLQRLLGQTLLRDADAAHRRLEDARAIVANPRATVSERAEAEAGVRELEPAAREKYVRTERAFQRALEIDPRDADAMMNLGAMRYNVGDYPAAIAWFDRIRKTSRDEEAVGAAIVFQGHCYFQMAEFEEALKRYEEYLALRPNGKAAPRVRSQAEAVRTLLQHKGGT